MTVKPFPQSRASISTGFLSVQLRQKTVLKESDVFFAAGRKKHVPDNPFAELPVATGPPISQH